MNNKKMGNTQASKEEQERVIKLAEEDKKKSEERKKEISRLIEEAKLKREEQFIKYDRNNLCDRKKECFLCNRKTNNGFNLDICIYCIITQLYDFYKFKLYDKVRDYNRFCSKCFKELNEYHPTIKHFERFNDRETKHDIIFDLNMCDSYYHIMMEMDTRCDFKKRTKCRDLFCYYEENIWTYGLCPFCVYNEFKEYIKAEIVKRSIEV